MDAFDMLRSLAADLAGTLPAKVAPSVPSTPSALTGKLPLATPGPYMTSGGVKGSEKLARLYKWINARGISLQTMSTDECVLAALPRLLQAAKDLDAAIAHVKAGGVLPAGTASLPDLEFIARALAGLMTRLPANRIGSY